MTTQNLATDDCSTCVNREEFPVEFENESISWETCPVCKNEYIFSVSAHFLWEDCAICGQEFDTNSEMIFNRETNPRQWECIPCVKTKLRK